MARLYPGEARGQLMVCRLRNNQWLRNGLIQHNLIRPKGLVTPDVFYDIGAGLRPIGWHRKARQVCVEPCVTYANGLRKAKYEVIEQTALEFMQSEDGIDFVYLLDVIEHMDKDEGEEVKRLIEAKVRRQAVIFTPLGFMEQLDDGWGTEQDIWQLHRSGWLPTEFEGWHCADYARGFFAVLTK